MKLNPGLQANPIIVKELRSRMRGARAFVVLTGVLFLLGGVSYLLYRMVMATSVYTSFPLSPQIGQVLFVGLVLVELLLICFVAPAVTAGSISSEQEKLTYEMLLTTPLHPASILWGKLISSLGYIFLLIFAAVPMASLVFIFGGVSPGDMFKALAILLAVAVMLGVTGLFFSALLGRTIRAMVATYLTVLLGLLAGPIFVYVFVGVTRQTVPPQWILIPNPVSALFSALTPAQMGGGPSEIFWGLARIMGGADLSNPGLSGIPRPLYHYSLVLYAAISLCLYLLATRLVQPVRRWRLGWKGILTALAILLLFVAVVAVAYLTTASRYEWVPGLDTPTPVAPDVMGGRGLQQAVPMPAIQVPAMPIPTEAPVPALSSPTPPESTPDEPAPTPTPPPPTTSLGQPAPDRGALTAGPALRGSSLPRQSTIAIIGSWWAGAALPSPAHQLPTT